MAVAATGSTSTRERLLRTGLAQARRRGVRSITVRGICQQAGANLGTFVYHFGSRDAFVTEVIERWYAPLLQSLADTVDRELPPLQRLRALVLQMADWAAANRRFITHVLMDAAGGEPAAVDFVRSLAGRHPALILRVIGEAQAVRVLPAGEPVNMLLFLMGAIALPMLLVERMTEARLAPADLSRALARFAHEREFRQQRLDWAIAGLATEGAHAGRRASLAH
ncbi:MAG TPA: TetR/AcrR family transcriptional regulator [Burkholderiaceae bacterium]|nr:TetR/AcrR family transcriptional regulator [Burkholderiaceae bacterium]HQR71348.1 TetR/AcrR family transcriptional regulator [Burkholderiaceae bacterium]